MWLILCLINTFKFGFIIWRALLPWEISTHLVSFFFSLGSSFLFVCLCWIDLGFLCLNGLDIEKMVSLKGMVIRCSSIIPEIREAVFRCIVCGYHSEPVVVDRGKCLLLCSFFKFNFWSNVTNGFVCCPWCYKVELLSLLLAWSKSVLPRTRWHWFIIDAGNYMFKFQ